ncbi:MAG: ATPase, T2SS/T4P/T4SS family, partial [archaeon]|nr:ATPase, T2SS/T4P/T4SS family [archaeon]
MRQNSIGWFTLNPKEGELETELEKSDKWTIAKLREGRIKYFLTRFPELSVEEKQIVSGLTTEFRAGNKRASGKNIKGHLKKHCIANLVELEIEQKEYVLRILESVLNGFGAMDDILCNPKIEEIALIGTNKPVFVFHSDFGWIESNLFFENQQAVCDIVNRMSQSIGRRLSFQTPSINAVLPDGSRLHAAIPPVAFSGPCFTIRKFSKGFFTPLQLVENHTLSVELAAFLWMALETDCSILIAGNTGSGKTTTLNALFSFVPAAERIIVAEETPEISLPHSHVVKLNVVKQQGVGMRSLIIDTLRMRPDRVVVGEVRSSDEVLAFIDTLLAGQGKGSYGTFHSQSCNEVVKRALSLGVSPMNLATIDLVIIQRRWDKVVKGKRKEVRHVTEVGELLVEKDEVKLNRLFEFDFGKGQLRKCNKGKRVVEKIKRSFSINEKGMAKEAKRREKFL